MQYNIFNFKTHVYDMIIVTREYSIKRHHIQYTPNTTIITHKALHHHQNLYKKIYISYK